MDTRSNNSFLVSGINPHDIEYVTEILCAGKRVMVVTSGYDDANSHLDKGNAVIIDPDAMLDARSLIEEYGIRVLVVDRTLQRAENSLSSMAVDEFPDVEGIRSRMLDIKMSENVTWIPESSFKNHRVIEKIWFRLRDHDTFDEGMTRSVIARSHHGG